MTVALLFITLYCSFAFASALPNESKCFEEENKNYLVGGWYLFEPYQYNKVTSGGSELTGMDVEMANAISTQLKLSIKYDQVSWDQHLSDLRDGKRDIASGATFNNERAKYAYFSKPYRFEETSLFVRKDSPKVLEFKTTAEYISQLRLQNFRLGILKGSVYGDPLINAFINDPANKDIIYSYDNTSECIKAILRAEIDGFMADRVVEAATILNKKTENFVEIPLKLKVPIHFMFSKKSVPIETVDHFNRAIESFVETPEYKRISKAYLYPILLIKTIGSNWFYILGVIGTIAFAMSGIAIAAKENSTLFGTFLFAMLPSIGGGIMRDLLLHRDTIGIFLTPIYMYYILIVVLVGFASVRLLSYYNTGADEDSFIKRFWDNLLIICDALGQAAFVVTGVVIVIMAKIEPIELWGPFFAFLTSNGGGILRDLFRSDKIISCISEGINAEISITWGLIFSLFLSVTANDPTSNSLEQSVIIITAGAFITRLLAVYLKIPNLRFRAER
jgi:polar amino acid transport system substrate-binding protein